MRIIITRHSKWLDHLNVALIVTREYLITTPSSESVETVKVIGKLHSTPTGYAGEILPLLGTIVGTAVHEELL